MNHEELPLLDTLISSQNLLHTRMPQHAQRVPLTNPSTSYRSKTFTAKCGVNPLVTSAAGLLAIVEKLRESSHYREVPLLAQQLTQEIKIFEVSTQKQGYNSEIILLARYILCSVIDEIILYTPWGALGLWEPHKLLMHFQNESWGGERFFVILERTREDATAYIDLLELMYLCLSMGYEGKYRLVDQNKSQLDKISDELYRCIRWQRGEMKKKLLLAQPRSIAINKHGLPPLWLIITLASAVLITAYTGFSFLLARSTAPIYQQLQAAKTGAYIE